MSTLAICWHMLRTGARSEMQYRANFLIEVAFGLVYQTVGFAFIWVVVGKFSAIGGWSLAEVTLLYGIQLAGHGLWALAFSRILLLDYLVHYGEYDRMLTRPLPIVLQFMFGGFRVATLGDALGAVVLLGVGLRSVDISWSAQKILYLVFAIFGSGMLRGAFELVMAAFTFRFLGSPALMGQWLSELLFGQFSGYPLDIFNFRLRSFLTFVIPTAFVAWVPGSVLLDRTGDLPFPAWFAWCSPILGFLLLILAWWLFIRESRHYQSSGS